MYSILNVIGGYSVSNVADAVSVLNKVGLKEKEIVEWENIYHKFVASKYSPSTATIQRNTQVRPG